MFSFRVTLTFFLSQLCAHLAVNMAAVSRLTAVFVSPAGLEATVRMVYIYIYSYLFESGNSYNLLKLPADILLNHWRH